jgi:hypothetical protein
MNMLVVFSSMCYDQKKAGQYIACEMQSHKPEETPKPSPYPSPEQDEHK